MKVKELINELKYHDYKELEILIPIFTDESDFKYLSIDNVQVENDPIDETKSVPMPRKE